MSKSQTETESEPSKERPSVQHESCGRCGMAVFTCNTTEGGKFRRARFLVVNACPATNGPLSLSWKPWHDEMRAEPYEEKRGHASLRYEKHRCRRSK
jgi:hypothetical protein